jgi:hypothetical protein
MSDQQSFFDPQRHSQPPPVVPLRPDGLAPPPRPAPPPPPPRPTPQAEAAHWRPTEPIQDVVPAYVRTAQIVSRILATRFLCLLFVLTASAIWGVTTWQPTELRIVAAAVYSVLVGWPLVWLYFRVK